MAIPDEEVAQVRGATDLVALIGEHSALRRQGRRWVGLCPFHAEKTPSFSVNAEEGLYYCFGCQASGDAISFVREVERLDFAEAVRFLADRAGVTLHEDEAAGADHRRRAQLLEAMERAVSWYHERLLSAPDAGRARDYLRSRGYDGEVVRQFRLGWAPEGWDELSGSIGLPAGVLESAGLAFVNRRGRVQDAFRGRVLFPICDPSGRPVAIGGRVLPPGPAGEPKYKNSPETPIYAKRRTLYALNWAKHDVIASGEVVVCEGYTDVIGCFRAGIPRAVATCGTALAEDHFRLLRNFARRIVLAYDADAAGQTAVGRVYEWERRHEVDVAVAALPRGSDPGQLAQEDPEALRQALAGARPFLQFRVDAALSGDLSTPEARAKAAERALDVIAEHPDALVRDQYLMTVAGRCRLEPESLRALVDAARRGSPARPRHEGRTRLQGGSRSANGRQAADDAGENARSPRSGAPAVVATRGPAREALRFMVHERVAISPYLHEILFESELDRRTYRVLAEHPEDHLASLIALCEVEDPEVADLLRRLAVEEPVVPAESLGTPAYAVAVQLVRLAARRELREAGIRVKAGGVDLAQTSQESVFLQYWLGRLEEPGAADEATSRLVAWLSARGTCS